MTCTLEIKQPNSI